MFVRLLLNIASVEVFGLLMYFVLAYKYAVRPEYVGITLTIIIHTFLVLMLVFPFLMSYFMLAVHQMLSTKLRTLLLLLMISMSFEGPGMNAMMNIHRVAEGMACVHTDISSSLKDVRGRAGDLKSMVANRLQNLIIKIAAPINKFRGILREIDKKVRRIFESIRRQYRELANLTNLCHRFMKKPYAICKNFFDKMFIKCVSTDNLFSLPGCDVIKRGSSICETTGSVVENNVCNFPSVVKKVIVNGYFSLVKRLFAVGTKTAKTTLFFHVKAARLAQKGLKVVGEEIVDIRNMKIHYYRGEEGDQDFAVHKTAVFTFKFKYHEEYQNTYLTDEFEKIDLDLALRGQTKVLPLNKDEKLKVM
ncbi:hypothetical protein DICVIV_03891 [Dictyocaulus viviparus]|uniref:Dendritic cell-specific transmembrane protein-like domain-containing protein n=1 Tax=Dictyocaulus viviparus TaxID=29172 RepID=A0A0D8Y1M0_DICVI|nr:hypothetical protein DICVIV_03891 [Dictyocaulus viviparus]